MSNRGPHPDDARLFAPAALAVLRTAADEVHWLLDRGYALPGVLTFVGNRHALEERARTALQRVCCGADALRARLARERPTSALRGARVSVDAFNLVVLLEVALAGGLLLRGRDGALRDLAGLRGSYHLLAQTERAVDLLFAALAAHEPAHVELLVDAPVSNSGRLRALLEARGAAAGLAVEATLVPDADPVLFTRPLVCSGDAAVLERAGAWCNVGLEVVRAAVPGAWLVELFAAPA